MSQERPVGVTVLAVAACLASASLLVYSVAVFSEVFKGRFVGISGNIVLIVVAIGLLALASLSGVAALDLWKIRMRGRSLTITSMVFLCLLGGFFAVADPRRDMEFYLACAASALTVWAIAYLFLPNVRRKFETKALQAPDHAQDP